MAVSLDELTAPAAEVRVPAQEPVRPLPYVPPNAPLAMPTQSFKRFGPKEAAVAPGPLTWGIVLARLFVFGGGLLLTL
jgi:membrane glycosyltransferase